MPSEPKQVVINVSICPKNAIVPRFSDRLENILGYMEVNPLVTIDYPHGVVMHLGSFRELGIRNTLLENSAMLHTTAAEARVFDG